MPLRKGFTLIELLVVIAIIAVLSVVVVLSLNPAELLRQSRDANRLSDLSTLNSALALYTTDQAGQASFSLGNASSVYVSLPDSSSTCGTWNLPALPSGYTYTCVASTSSKNINNSGWIPVNFSNISGGAPFSNLPLDGTNQSSTGLYYTYYSNGSQFITTAIPESQKQKTALGAKSIIQNYPEVLANGSNLGISPLFNTSGLVGYWPMDEGAGSTTIDQSGNNNNGTATGTVPYYAAGRVGPYAESFNGSNNKVSQSHVSTFDFGTGDFSTAFWVYPQGTWGGTTRGLVGQKLSDTAPGFQVFHSSLAGDENRLYLRLGDASGNGGDATPANGSVITGQWTFCVAMRQSGNLSWYINGALNGASVWNPKNISGGSANFNIGYADTWSAYFNGYIDDVRIYSRALSPAEIQALYNAER